MALISYWWFLFIVGLIANLTGSFSKINMKKQSI